MRSGSWGTDGDRGEGVNADTLIEQGVPSAQANRIAIRANLQAALRASFDRCGGLWLCAMILLSLGFMVVLLWVMWIFSQHEGEHCDEPVASILNVLIVLLFLNFFQSEMARCLCVYRTNPQEERSSEPCRVVTFRRVLFLALLCWPPIAGVLLWQVKSCPAEIVRALYWLVAYLALFILIAVFLPAFFVTTMLCLIRRGCVRLRPSIGRDPSLPAFDADLVDNLPKLTLDAKLLEDLGNRQCPICIEEFDDAQPISRTNCQPNPHVFHTECLRGWATVARTCPLCRADLISGEVPGRSDGSLVDIELSAP